MIKKTKNTDSKGVGSMFIAVNAAERVTGCNSLSLSLGSHKACLEDALVFSLPPQRMNDLT